jgi:hypothetical protein
MTGISTLPEVASLRAARGGGGGPRPGDPSALAARALSAARGDDKETAAKLFDYGLENYGPSFAATYNALRDQQELQDAANTPSKPGVLKQVATAAVDNIKVGDDAGYSTEVPATGFEMKPLSGLPRTEGGKGGIFGAGGLPDAGGLPRSPQEQGPPWQTNRFEPERAKTDSTYRESIKPTPDQLIVVPDAPQIPFMRPDRDTNWTRLGQTLKGSADSEAIARDVPVEQVVAERAADLKAAEDADAARKGSAVPPVPAEPPAPPASPEPTASSTGMITPPVAPVPTSNLPPVDQNAVPAQNLPPVDPNAVPVPNLPPVDPNAVPAPRRYGLQRDGSYIDYPPGNEVEPPENTVTVVKKTGERPRAAGDPDPRTGTGTSGSSVRNVGPPRQVVSPPGSPGLASLVTPTAPPGGGAVVPAATPEAAAADPAAAAPERGSADFMGDPNIWSFLVSAGLGAMASDSPTALGGIGLGGLQGLKQLGELRKEKRERLADKDLAAYRKSSIDVSREQNANTVNIANQSNALGRDRLTSDTEHNKKSIEVQTYSIDSQNQRSQDQIASSEREAELNRQSAGQNLNTQIQANLALKGLDIKGTRDLMIERAGIELRMSEFKQSMENQGKVVQREDLYNFLVTDPKGPQLEPKIAGTMVAGFGPQKPDALKPLGDKEVSLANTNVAVSLFGEDATEAQLLALIPEKYRAGYHAAIGSAEDPATAAARGLAFFMKHGVKANDKSTFGGYFGSDWELRIQKPKAATAPPAVQRYDQATGKLVAP